MTRFTIFRIQAVIGTAYIAAGAAKLAGAPLMVEAFDMIGLGQTVRVAVGAVEVVGGLCLFVPMASVYAALVLGCTIVAMLGMTVGHVARLGIERQQIDVPQTAVWQSYRASLESGESSPSVEPQMSRNKQLRI
jgi:uncharacterized membrane protein YphA (DoxX/SURF4 family)